MTMIWPGERRSRADGAGRSYHWCSSCPSRSGRSCWCSTPRSASLRSSTLSRLIGSGRLRIERHVGRVCSLDEPEDVELVIENPGRRARSMRLRDDVPDEFSAEPAAFEFPCPAAGRPSSLTVSCPRNVARMCFEQVDALVASRMGFWRGQYRWPLSH